MLAVPDLPLRELYESRTKTRFRARGCQLSPRRASRGKPWEALAAHLRTRSVQPPCLPAPRPPPRRRRSSTRSTRRTTTTRQSAPPSRLRCSRSAELHPARRFLTKETASLHTMHEARGAPCLPCRLSTEQSLGVPSRLSNTSSPRSRASRTTFTDTCAPASSTARMRCVFMRADSRRNPGYHRDKGMTVCSVRPPRVC